MGGRADRRARAVPIAQSPPAMADWLTDGGDAQRTAWQKNEHILNVSNVKGMKLLWKYKTDNVAREMHALFPPLIVGRVHDGGGPQAGRDCRGHLRQHLRDRRRDRRAVVEAPFRYDVLAASRRQLRHAVSGRPARDAGRSVRAKRRAATSFMRPRGTAGSISSMSRQAEPSRRRNCSCRPTASRTA